MPTRHPWESAGGEECGRAALPICTCVRCVAAHSRTPLTLCVGCLLGVTNLTKSLPLYDLIIPRDADYNSDFDSSP